MNVNQLGITSEEIHSEITAYIKTNILFDERIEIGFDQSLLGSGVLDSTAILELVSHIEEEYSLVFQDEELVGENFDSIARIAAIIQKKAGGQ